MPAAKKGVQQNWQGYLALINDIQADFIRFFGES
jgi:hypothetical protein